MLSEVLESEVIIEDVVVPRVVVFNEGNTFFLS